MRRLLAVVWLLITVGLLAYHYGPGQTGLARDKVAKLVVQAKQQEAKENWKGAMQAYADAAAAVPESDRDTRLKLRLAHGKARALAGELPEALVDMEGAFEDAVSQNADAELTREIRGTLAGLHYYAAWVMRLEGAGAEEWTLETEQARQHFRLLAEGAQASDEKSADGYQKNLEATVRLARMDLSDLKALPLPKQCQNCSDCSGKARKQRQSRTQVKKQSKDARQQVSEDKAKNAGKNDRPEGTGS
jgi:hypothetical protein